MKFEQFRLKQWGVCNDWAIRIDDVPDSNDQYKFSLVEEKDAVIDNIEFTGDPVINMDLEKFIAMHTNNNFVDFINKGGSILKASDTSQDVLDNICEQTGKSSILTREQLDKKLEEYKLGEPRYMGYDQDKNTAEIDAIQYALDSNEENEEDSNGEQPTAD